MSEPNTSEPLHSSCTRQAILQARSPSAATSPNRYTVWPPISGRNCLRSDRVTSSGNMPPVCSNRWRRRSVSDAPQRAATPGNHHTGSIATLVQVTSPVAVTTCPSTSISSNRNACFSSGTVRRALVTAMVGRMSQLGSNCLSERLADDVPVGIDRHDPVGIHPLRGEAPSGPPARYRSDRDDAACSGCRRPPRGSIGRAGVRADHVASSRIRQRADHQAPRLGRGGSPVDLGRRVAPAADARSTRCAGARRRDRQPCYRSWPCLAS